jgi:hypothetical protein
MKWERDILDHRSIRRKAMNHMNPATPDSLYNIDQFAKKSDLPPSYRAKSAGDASPDMAAA